MEATEPSVLGELVSWGIFGTKAVVGLVCTGLALLYANQDKLLYFPTPPNFPKTPSENPPGCRSPSEWTTSGAHNSRGAKNTIPFEDHFVQTADGMSIHTWLMLQPNSGHVPTLVYFHGNAGNMGFRLNNAAEMYGRAKINILMMDYRGYGASTGVPTEKGLNLDADAVLHYAAGHPKLKGSRLVVFGRSLGGAVCFSAAHRLPQLVSGVVVENTFTSISAMVDKLLPFISPLKSFALRIKWDSDTLIRSITQPVLFISGSEDELVPPDHMKTLYKLAKERPNSRGQHWFEVKGGSHNDSWERAGPEYYKRLKSFMDIVNEGRDQGTNEGRDQDPDPNQKQEKEKEQDRVGAQEGGGGGGGIEGGGGGSIEGEGGEAKLERDDASLSPQEDYCLVEGSDISDEDTGNGGGPSVALPTMGKNFQVK